MKASIYLCLFTFLANTYCFCQIYSSDFDWVRVNNISSNTTVNTCGGPVQITLTSGSVLHTMYSNNTSAIFPNNTSTNNANSIPIIISFSQPVNNLKLLVNDIDENQGPGPGSTPYETVAVTSTPTSPFIINSIPGSPAFGQSNGTLDPIGNNDTKGWLHFSTPVTIVSLVYNRPGVRYGLLLDSFSFEINCDLNLTVTNDTICKGDCSDISSTVTNNIGQVSYAWDNNINNSSPNQLVCPTQTTTYRVIANSINGQKDTAFSTITVIEKPNVKLGNDTVICTFPFLLDALNTGNNYLWSNGSTNQTLSINSPGHYNVSVYNNVCTSKDTINIISPSVNLGNDTLICSGDSLVLNAYNNNAAYSWNDGSNNSKLTIYDSGIYFVESNVLGCIVSDSIVVYTQKVNASLGFKYKDSCQPVLVKFNDSSSVNTGYINNWNWSLGNGHFSSNKNPEFSFNTSGNYDLYFKVTSDIGCVDDTLIYNYLSVYPKANAQFDFTSQTSTDNVNFINLSTNSSSWKWNFGDGYSSLDKNPTHSYLSENDNYDIVLMASNTYGCNDTTNKNIVLKNKLNLFAPNSFSPNSDNFNETWTIANLEKFEEVELLIFNRWGNKIFETNNPVTEWDGKHKGVIVEPGVYIWKLNVKFPKGIRKQYIGHINVIK